MMGIRVELVSKKVDRINNCVGEVLSLFDNLQQRLGDADILLLFYIIAGMVEHLISCVDVPDNAHNSAKMFAREMLEAYDIDAYPEVAADVSRVIKQLETEISGDKYN